MNRNSLVYMTKERNKALAKRDDVEKITGHWWCVDPQRGLMFYDANMMSPQCRSDKSAAEKVRSKLYPWAKLEYIVTAYRPLHSA